MSNVLITGGTVVDGTGAPARAADVRVIASTSKDLEKLVKSLPPERIAELIDQLKADHPEWYEVTRVRANIRHRTAAS